VKSYHLVTAEEISPEEIQKRFDQKLKTKFIQMWVFSALIAALSVPLRPWGLVLASPFAVILIGTIVLKAQKKRIYASYYDRIVVRKGEKIRHQVTDKLVIEKQRMLRAMQGHVCHLEGGQTISHSQDAIFLTNTKTAKLIREIDIGRIDDVELSIEKKTVQETKETGKIKGTSGRTVAGGLFGRVVLGKTGAIIGTAAGLGASRKTEKHTELTTRTELEKAVVIVYLSSTSNPVVKLNFGKNEDTAREWYQRMRAMAGLHRA